ncbi:MAG TPA: carboxypeptidase-like regulatory domain-containing protein [Puia sp.]|jgi:hypothetical protein|nr:carboxypeptidase-like regulatory domain-containing protein [Puia sp.]
MDFQAFIIQGYMAVCLALTFNPAPSLQLQGIEGVARRITGNRMPSPKFHPGPPAGTHAIICVFALTNQNQVTNSGAAGLYSAVHTNLVRQSDTDDSGHFRILLPPGTYSVFTKKGPLFYATRRDEKNNIAPVNVLPGKITRVDCSVESDHTAVY